MMWFDAKEQKLCFTVKLTKEFLEVFNELSSVTHSDALEKLIVDKFQSELSQFEIHKEEFEAEETK